jgi:addiction module RelB/DinJ family antitoxin
MTVSVKLDNNIKSAADNLFRSYGMDTAEAMKMFVYMAVKSNRFPFTFEPYAINDSESRQSLEDAINDTLNDTNLYGPFDTAKEMIDALLED